MAKPGRRPLSAADKELRGNPGRRSLSPALPPAPGGEMFMPNEVVNNERAAFYWRWYLDHVAPDHLAPVDSALFAGLCMALAWRDEAFAEVEKTGMLVKAPNTGLPIQNPYMAVANKQQEIARKLAVELSLTVAERNRVPQAGGATGGPGRGRGGRRGGNDEESPEERWCR